MTRNIQDFARLASIGPYHFWCTESAYVGWFPQPKASIPGTLRFHLWKKRQIDHYLTTATPNIAAIKPFITKVGSNMYLVKTALGVRRFTTRTLNRFVADMHYSQSEADALIALAAIAPDTQETLDAITRSFDECEECICFANPHCPSLIPGCAVFLRGPIKSGKTFAAMRAALSAATRSRVLFLNDDLRPDDITARLNMLATEMSLDVHVVCRNLDIVPMRGHPMPIGEALLDIPLARYEVIVVDSHTRCCNATYGTLAQRHAAAVLVTAER
jgi:hypothetical protein